MRIRVTALLLLALAACGDDGAGADGGPPDGAPQPGQLRVTWLIFDDEGTAITCEQIGADTVRLLAFPDTGANAIPATFDCEDGMGIAELDPGGYRVRLQLRYGAAGVFEEIILQGPADPAVQVALGQVAGAGMAEFTVNPIGTMTFKVSAHPTLTNCDPEGTGAGVTAFSIAVERGGVCAPMIGDVGGTTYEANCSMGVVACFEKDDVVTFADIPSGDYVLSLYGYEEGNLCYQKIDIQATVYGGEVVTDLGTQQVDFYTPNADVCVVP